MSKHTSATELDRLAAFSPAVRSVAHAVVRDGHLAEDVVQDALLAVIESGTGGARAPRRWFTGVVRNLARRRVRGDVARDRREKAVARPESEPSTAEVVARTELHRKVVAAVLDLPDPYRETLLLRYFDELAPREIAERQGVPGGTVRSRITRGVELLRERFDREADGDRRAWALALLPILAPPAAVLAPQPGSLAPQTGSLASQPGSLAPQSGSAAPATNARPPSSAGVTSHSATAVSAAGWGAVLMAVNMKKLAVGAIVAALLALLAGAAYVLSNSHESAPSLHAASRTEEAAVRGRVTPPDAEGATAAGAVDGEPEPDVAADRELHFQGLVLRPDRAPASGAHVRCYDATGRVVEARADASGRFALRPRYDNGAGRVFTVRAWDDQGNAATERVPLLTGFLRADVPTLMLRPAHGVVVRVLARDGSPAHGARVACREYDSLLLGVGTTDTRGEVRFDHLPDCDVVVRVFKEGFGRALAMDVMAGRPATEVELRLSRRDVQVRVVDQEGAPVPGVRLFAQQLWSGTRGTIGTFDPLVSIAATDPEGRTVVRDLAEDDGFVLRVLAPGSVAPRTGRWGAFTGGGVTVKPGVREVELTLPHAARLRWPMRPTAPNPPDGTRLRLVAKRLGSLIASHHSAIAWVEDGHVVADVDVLLLEQWGVKAVAPAGQFCVLDGNAAGQPVEFVSTREVTLRVVDSNGNPVPALRTHAWGEEFAQNIETDDDGVVVLEGVPSYGLDLHLMSGLSNNDMHQSESVSARVRIEPEQTNVTLTLGEVIDLVVHLQVDGKPGIPATLSEIHTGFGRGFAAVEDHEAATVTVRVRRSLRGTPVVVARAYGYQEARRNARVNADGSIGPVTLNLLTGATFRGRVIADQAHLRTAELQAWDADAERWRRQDVSRMVRGMGIRSLLPRGDGSVEVAGLPAGRYRLIGMGGTATSEPVEIEPGVIAPVCILQVTEPVRVTGQIEMPDGAPIDKDVVLFVESGGTRRGARLGRVSDGVVLGPDGRFTVSIRDGQETTLRVVHPRHSPHAEHGVVTVSGAEDGVVLQLVVGRESTLRIPPHIDAAVLPDSFPVMFFAPDALDQPVDMKLATRVGAEYRIGGAALGKFTLWIDSRSRFVPLLLPDVDLAAGVVDLELHEGASVAVRLTDDDVRAQAAREGAILRATWASGDGYKHTRVFEARDGAPLRVTGLIPGTYEIQLHVLGSAVRTAKKTVTIERPDQELAIEFDEL